MNLVGNAIKFTSRGFVHVILSQVADPGGARKEQDEKGKEAERTLKEKADKSGEDQEMGESGGIEGNGENEESEEDEEGGEQDRVVWVGITVEDSGVGMSESTLKALFTPFTQVPLPPFFLFPPLNQSFNLVN